MWSSTRSSRFQGVGAQQQGTVSSAPVHSVTEHIEPASSAAMSTAGRTSGARIKTKHIVRRSPSQTALRGCVPTRRPISWLFRRKATKGAPAVAQTERESGAVSEDDGNERVRRSPRPSDVRPGIQHASVTVESGQGGLRAHHLRLKTPDYSEFTPEMILRAQSSSGAVGRSTIVSLGSPAVNRVTISTTDTELHELPTIGEAQSGVGAAVGAAQGGSPKLASVHVLTRQSSSAERRSLHADGGDDKLDHVHDSMHDMHLDEHDEEGYEEVDINTPSAGYLLAMRGDDGSSDWNSDFSSPSSRHRSDDQPTTETMTIDPSGSARLQDRARGRGVLEVQQKIREQERCLRKINELRDMFLEIRPAIMRLLALELPDRGLQIGTLAFASTTRDTMGSSEISVEEEELWELWREMEALLALMDNENGMRPQVVESRISLSKKRSIMMAFCDWEQYSQYVQDAWTRAVEGIAQPNIAHISRNSSTSTGLNPSKRSSASSVANNISSASSSWTASRGMTTGSSASARRWAQQRRRSVIGVAPESLQRIVSEAERIKDLCVFHLGKMSPSWIDFMRRVELALEGDGPASRDEAKDGSEGDDEDDSVPPLPRQPVQQEPRQVLVGAGPGTYGSVVV